MKKISSFQLVWILITALLLNIPCTVSSRENVRVAVLPFEIQSQEKLDYLKTEIPEIIKKQLEKNSAVIINPSFDQALPLEKIILSNSRIRELGKRIGADFIVWGNITCIGQQYSIDAKMIESKKETPPLFFSAEGEHIENLATTVQKLARDISIKLMDQEKIATILITGNDLVETDAILRVIQSKPDDIYLKKNLSADLKSLYEMGYFEDVRIESEDSPKGKIITFTVKERPKIRKIILKGNSVFDDDEIKEQGYKIRTGSILNIFKINSDIKRIETLYKDKNYHNAKVSYTIQPLDNNQADIEFTIQEGKKIRIKTISFEGNTIKPDLSFFKKLRRIFIPMKSSTFLKTLMKTSEKGFFSWITSSGELITEDLNQDIDRIKAYYHIHGYIQARIGEPQIAFEGDWIYIKIKIEEGLQFKVGAVDIEGDLIKPKDELMKAIKVTEEEFCNRGTLQEDVLRLTDIYSDEGYFYADIYPQIDQDVENRIANIRFIINKGKLVYFDKIIISGNTKTRDKVIRRELKVYEQELYSGKKLKRSVRNLYRLDFFENIKVNPVKEESDDKMNLKIEVSEKPTGAFTFGAGYSSVEKMFATVSVSQSNFRGLGQILKLQAEVGGKTNRYSFSFTEPWLFDIPLSAGFDLYNTQQDYDTYDRDTKGLGLRASYPVLDFTRVYLSYNYEIGTISNIDSDASATVKYLEGSNVTSSVTTSLRYDSRDRAFNPTEGSEHSISLEYAGGPVGGDIAFTKIIAETGWYIPLFKNTVGFIHGKTGYVHENEKGKLPDYERFYLGGMNSLRGFDWRDVSPTDPPNDRYGIKVGGDKFVQFNFEFIVPLIEEAGIVGVIFYDTGNTYDNYERIDLGNMRKSAGYGFRWYSPIGPIRIEYGKILDPKEWEDNNGSWEFTMGTAF